MHGAEQSRGYKTPTSNPVPDTESWKGSETEGTSYLWKYVCTVGLDTGEFAENP